MIPSNNQLTSFEISKKMKELGFEQKSSWSWLKTEDEEEYDLCIEIYDGFANPRTRMCLVETNINKTEDVFNFTLDKNNNYIVFTENFTPILVHNCSHGAGRVMSRTKAKEVLNLEIEQKN